MGKPQTSRERADDYRSEAASLRRQIARLTGDDPEDAEAAREWSEMAAHAEMRADQIERWATYEKGQ